jgi:hypothetical protein
LPALIARADQKWHTGNQSEALTLYRRVLDHAGRSSSYGQRAWSRIREAEARDAETPSTDPSDLSPSTSAEPEGARWASPPAPAPTPEDTSTAAPAGQDEPPASSPSDPSP